MLVIGIVAVLVIAIQLALYTLWLPDPFDGPIEPHPLDRHLGTALHIAAYALSVMRLPLCVAPYLAKLFVHLALKASYTGSDGNYFLQALRVVGDGVNLGLTTAIILILTGAPSTHVLPFLFYAPLVAETIRLITEKGLMVFSGIWQIVPHRRIARAIHSSRSSRVFWSGLSKRLARYCRYYSLSDDERAQHILCVLKSRAELDRDAAERLEYVRALRIVPRRRSLRTGEVRDIACGEVFIHASWTNDPWLLIGQALRRAPWVFDPRYLRRPFCYRTESNPLVTRFVLCHARYCPSYAIYQFGHEIKAARHEVFYRLMRWLGVDIEETVREDGTANFDPFIGWIEKRLGRASARSDQRPLWKDEEAIVDILRRSMAGETMSAPDIARRYTYPLKYVEEVLWDKLAPATTPHDGAVDGERLSSSLTPASQSLPAIQTQPLSSESSASARG